jgi:[ribosomal protein S5]-alanine N-acetyltransferase
MRFPPDILTSRLRLIAATPQLLRAGNETLPQIVQAEVPASWPPEHWEPHVFDLLEQQYLSDPVTLSWNRYMILQHETPTLIGTVGAFSKPHAEAEVGYSVLTPWQCRGFATESLRALLPLIFESDSAQTICAHPYPYLTASIRVLEKCGFCFTGPGQEEGTIRYQFERAQFNGAHVANSLSDPNGRLLN